MKITLTKILPKEFEKIIGLKIENNEIEIKNNGISFCYANNGTGKTIFANYFISNSEFNGGFNIDKFSYEDNLHIDQNEFWTLGDSIENMEKLKIKNDIILKQLKENIFIFFRGIIKISSGDDLYKNFLKKYSIFEINFDKFILAKIKKSIDIDLKCIDIETIYKNIKDKIKEQTTLNLLITPDDFNLEQSKKVISDKSFLIILKVAIEIGKILNDILKKYDEFLKGINEDILFKKFNINDIEGIYDIIKNIENMKNCYICDTKIEDFNIIKETISKKIEDYNNEIKENEKIFLIEELLKNIPNDIKEDNEMYNFVKKLKNIKKNINNKSYIKELIEEIEKFKVLEEDFLKYLEINFIKYILPDSITIKGVLIEDDKNDLFSIEKNLYEIDQLQKNKILINEDDFNFFISIIEQYIGKNRIKFNKADNSITFDDSEIEEINTASTGERNFIAFGFTLLLALKKFEDKKLDAICLDDPFTTFDSNYKFYMLYILNYFSSIKKLPIIILTHSYESISSQLNSGFNNINSNFYLLRTLSSTNENTSKDNFGFINITKEEIDNMSFINSLQYVKEKIKEFIKEQKYADIAKIIFSFIPFLRAMAYILGDKNTKSILSEFMHFRKELNEIDDEQFALFIEKYLDIKNEISKIILEEIKKISLNKNLYEWLYNSSENKLPKNLLDKSLIILAKSIYFRKIIEKKCIGQDEVKYQKFAMPKQGAKRTSLREIIEESSLEPSIQIKLKSTRLIIQDMLHFESDLNLVMPAVEYSDKWFKSIENYILEIERKNENE